MKRYYVGMDIHKKTIWYCVKRADGEIVQEGRIRSTRGDLDAWLKTLPRPWVGGMEATLFTGWIYDYMKARGAEVQVGHPQRMKAISGKKQNDRLDARSLADLLNNRGGKSPFFLLTNPYHGCPFCPLSDSPSLFSSFIVPTQPPHFAPPASGRVYSP